MIFLYGSLLEFVKKSWTLVYRPSAGMEISSCLAADCCMVVIQRGEVDLNKRISRYS